jgi:hypothetical protein
MSDRDESEYDDTRVVFHWKQGVCHSYVSDTPQLEGKGRSRLESLGDLAIKSQARIGFKISQEDVR